MVDDENGNMVIGNEFLSAVINLKGAYLLKVDYKDNPLIVKSEDGKMTHGGAAVLIPYANRVRNARYTYSGRMYDLPKNDGRNSIHGLVRNVQFTCTYSTGESVELAGTVSDPGFPSTLSLRIRYLINRNTIRTEVSATNTGPQKCPYMVGFHPYFYTGSECHLETEEKSLKLCYSDEYFPDGNYEPFDFNGRGDLSSLKLDNCFAGEGKITIHTKNMTIGIERENFPYFVVYNGEYARGTSVAVEPMTGAPNCFNNGIGIINLEPGSSHECAYNVVVE